LLIVLSGPSGAGKDAILNRMRELRFPIEFITTVTTRRRRASERENIDYRFISEDKFQSMIENDEFVEWANVYGNFYGVPKQTIINAMEHQQDVMVKVDIQGAGTIKKLAPQAIYIFVMPPTLEELQNRLTQRKTESEFDMALRLKTAEDELKQLYRFDYLVLNRKDEIDRAVSDIEAIIRAEKCSLVPREVNLF